MPAGVPARVLEDVHERTLHLHRIDVHQREIAVERQRELVGTGRELGERRANQLVDRGPLHVRRGGARFQAREVEQVVHEARQAPRLLLDDRGHLLAFGVARATGMRQRRPQP